MARSRYSRSGAAQGPALPGLEDTIAVSQPASPVPRKSPTVSPGLIPARLVLELCRARRPELSGLLALVALRSSGGSWRATQREVATELGLPERTVRRHERELVELGALEVQGPAGGRRLRVLHGLVHKAPTPDTGVRSNRTPVSGSREDNGSGAREDPGTGRYLSPSVQVRAGARARAPLSAELARRLAELAGQLGVWPNVLPELDALAGELEAAWGADYLARYLGRLAQHVETREADRRAGLLLGSLRARVRTLGRGPRRAS